MGIEILDLREIPRGELLERLRSVQLRGYDGERAYRNATLSIKDFSTNDLWPCQRYVVRRGVQAIQDLREAVYLHSGERIDIYSLEGGLWVTAQVTKYLSPVDRTDIVVAEGDPIEVSETIVVPVLPPIVEHSVESGAALGLPDKPPRAINLINDGMHRCFAARWSGYRINCVHVIGASKPYYAFPLERKWMGVELVDSAPPSGDERKNYREPEDHKALFRDFNALFPGVQAKR